MKNALALLLLALTNLTALAQEQAKPSYTQMAHDFISSTRNLNKMVILENAQLYKGTFLKEILADNLFTKKELAHIKRQLNHPPIKKWTTELLPGTRIFTKHQLEERKKNGITGYHIFTSPIFLRSGSYCLFYLANNCGGTCGSGSMRLFYNFGGKWVIVKTYGYWIS